MSDSTVTQAQVRLSLAGVTDVGRKRKVVCALIGHSRVVEYCFGYVTCARCGAQVGDTLAGPSMSGHVFLTHLGRSIPECDCYEVLAKLTWKDRMMLPRKITAQLAKGKR
jgi:hypothetical protein